MAYVMIAKTIPQLVESLTKSHSHATHSHSRSHLQALQQPNKPSFTLHIRAHQKSGLSLQHTLYAAVGH
eukprot:scaffold474026_cov19-Prasinocladus_malaysianus.AAC.1